MRLWPIEVSTSLVPLMMYVGTRANAAQRRELVEGVEVREELGEHLERTWPRACCRRTRRTPRARRRRTRTGRRPGSRCWSPAGGPGRPARGARASPAISRGPTCPPTASGISRLTIRCVFRPPAVVEISADAGHPVLEDLGVLLGERHDRHAAHRVADEHHRALGDQLLEHPGAGRRRAGRWWRARCRERPDRPCERWS